MNRAKVSYCVKNVEIAPYSLSVIGGIELNLSWNQPNHQLKPVA